MIPRTWVWFIGMLTVAALVFIAPNVNVQQHPGTGPFGGLCPTGTPLALRSNGSISMQGRDSGLIGVAADALGMTRQALLGALSGDKTIADVALAKGIDPLKIVNAFVAPQFARINALVARGVITQKQADDAKESIHTYITVLVRSPIESWERQAHDPIIGQRPNDAGSGPTAQPGGRGL